MVTYCILKIKPGNMDVLDTPITIQVIYNMYLPKEYYLSAPITNFIAISQIVINNIIV